MVWMFQIIYLSNWFVLPVKMNMIIWICCFWHPEGPWIGTYWVKCNRKVSTKMNRGICFLWISHCGSKESRLLLSLFLSFRLTWWLFLVIMICSLIYGLVNAVIKYRAYPTSTTITSRKQENITFPAVTICNNVLVSIMSFCHSYLSFLQWLSNIGKQSHSATTYRYIPGDQNIPWQTSNSQGIFHQAQEWGSRCVCSMGWATWPRELTW